MITETTQALRDKWEPTAGIVTCDCGMAIVADGSPNQFSREIVSHSLSHHEEPIEAAGIMAFGKFLVDTRD